MINMIPLLATCLFFWSQHCYGLSVGSNTLFSREAAAVFPSADTDNTMLGFAAFEKGFTLQDSTTTCTYDDFMPISGPVDLAGGSLYLRNGIIFNNAMFLPSGGKFFGRTNFLEFPKQLEAFNIVGGVGGAFFPNLLTTDSILADRVRSIDWNANDTYLAAGDEKSPTFGIFYFDGTTVTATKTLDTKVAIHSVRWHPTHRYVAFAQDNGGTPNVEVAVYNFKNSTGSLTLTGSQNYNNNGNSVAWHPSGNFLVAGTTVTNKQLVSYTFSTTTGIITEKNSVNLANGAADSALSFAPDGNLVAVGVTKSPELRVYSFSAGTLALNSSIAVGITVAGLDWSPTGTYIAVVGKLGSGNSVRIYSHIGSTLSLVTGVETKEANSASWDQTGNFLAVGFEAIPLSRLKVYRFDKVAGTLTIAAEMPIPVSADNYSAQFSHSNNYLAAGDKNGTVAIYGIGRTAKLLFDNISLIFNSNVNINVPVEFSGACKINGRGRRIFVQSGGGIAIRPGGTLIIEDAELDMIGDSNLRCMTDRGAITLRNSLISLSRNYTFSRGSILFDEDTMITGTNKFIYATGLSSTIASQSTLFIDQGVTFSYAPRRGNKNLINMTNNTSSLYLNGCTLHSTRTGLQLDSGMVIFDNKVTFSSEARNNAEALTLKSGLTMSVMGGAQLELFGRIRYD